MTTTPSPSRRAVSIESASRAASGSATGRPVSGSIGRPSASRRGASRGPPRGGRRSGRRRPRSCGACTCRALGASDRSYCSPSTRTRTKPCLRALLEDPVALGLAVLDERAEDEQAGSLGQLQDLVDDLLDGLALDLVAVGAVRVADAGEQQPEVVVDLGDGADGRARVPTGALLVDRDGRATGRRSGRRRASPSGPGTAARRRSGSRRSGAGPRRRSCRTRGWTCRSRTAR